MINNRISPINVEYSLECVWRLASNLVLEATCVNNPMSPLKGF